MQQIIIQDDSGQWWKFEVPASADGWIEFYDEGYSGPYYAMQPFKEGGKFLEHVDGKGMGPDHDQYSGKLPAAYIWFSDETVVRGKRVKLS